MADRAERPARDLLEEIRQEIAERELGLALLMEVRQRQVQQLAEKSPFPVFPIPEIDPCRSSSP